MAAYPQTDDPAALARKQLIDRGTPSAPPTPPAVPDVSGLDDEQKNATLMGHFDTHVADDYFAKQPPERQERIRNNFYAQHAGGLRPGADSFNMDPDLRVKVAQSLPTPTTVKPVADVRAQAAPAETAGPAVPQTDRSAAQIILDQFAGDNMPVNPMALGGKMLHGAYQGLARSSIGTGKTVGELGVFAANRLPDGTPGKETVRDAGEAVSNYYDKQLEAYAPSDPDLRSGVNVVDKPELLLNPEYWAQGVGEMGGEIGQMMIAGAGTAAKAMNSVGQKMVNVGGRMIPYTKEVAERAAQFGAAIMGGIFGGVKEGTGTYGDLRKKEGWTEEQAAIAGTVQGASTVGLNAIGISALLKKLPAGSALAQGFSRILSAGTEAVTETAEGGTDAYAKMLAKYLTGESDFPKDWADKIVQGVKDEVNVAGPAFLTGLLFGGGGGTETSSKKKKSGWTPAETPTSGEGMLTEREAAEYIEKMKQDVLAQEKEDARLADELVTTGAVALENADEWKQAEHVVDSGGDFLGKLEDELDGKEVQESPAPSGEAGARRVTQEQAPADEAGQEAPGATDYDALAAEGQQALDSEDVAPQVAEQVQEYDTRIANLTTTIDRLGEDSPQGQRLAARRQSLEEEKAALLEQDARARNISQQTQRAREAGLLTGEDQGLFEPSRQSLLDDAAPAPRQQTQQTQQTQQAEQDTQDRSMDWMGQPVPPSSSVPTSAPAQQVAPAPYLDSARNMDPRLRALPIPPRDQDLRTPAARLREELRAEEMTSQMPTGQPQAMPEVPGAPSRQSPTDPALQDMRNFYGEQEAAGQAEALAATNMRNLTKRIATLDKSIQQAGPDTALGQKLADKQQELVAEHAALVNAQPSPVQEAPTAAPAVAQAPVSASAPAATAVAQTAKQTSAKPSPIGVNQRGQELFEDEKGVRYFVEDGVRVKAPVEMRPTRAGVQAVSQSLETLHADGHHDFLTGEEWEQFEAQKPQPTPAPESTAASQQPPTEEETVEAKPEQPPYVSAITQGLDNSGLSRKMVRVTGTLQDTGQKGEAMMKAQDALDSIAASIEDHKRLLECV